MTPDTAALLAQIRANEDAAAFYGGTPNRIILDPATVRALCDAADEVERLRKDVEALHGLLSAGAIGTAPGSDSHRMVLAMRDHYKRERDAARDEVERLRAAVVERDTRLAETIRYHDARVNRADEATDASRTAHAALVTGIETGLRESACAECDHDRCATYRSAASWVRDYAALDHHAPTTGATP